MSDAIKRGSVDDIFATISEFTKYPKEYNASTPTFGELGVNSLRAIAMITFLENQHSIRFDEEELNSFFSLGPASLAALIVQKINLSVNEWTK